MLQSRKKDTTRKMTERVQDTAPLLGGGAGEPGVEKHSRQLAKEVLSNLYDTKSAILGQAGLLVSVIYIYYHILQNPIILFSGHPIFNLAGIFILGEFILLVQPNPKSGEHKTFSGQLHGILNTLSTVSFGLGFFYIFYNKSIHGAQHITTWHATFGITTYSLLLLNMLLGVAQFWVPNLIFGSVNNGKRAYKYHRLLGYLTFLMLTLTVWLAIASDYNVNILHLKSYFLIPSLGLFLTVLFFRLQLHKVKFW